MGGIDRVIFEEKHWLNVTKKKSYGKITRYEIKLTLNKGYRIYWQDIDTDRQVV